MFDNFDNFAFMFDNLARDATVKVMGQVVDDLGVSQPGVIKEVPIHEPILNTLVPNDSYSTADGGQINSTVYQLESKHSEFNKNDEVITDDFGSFVITDKSSDVAGGLFVYTLKRKGGEKFV